EAPINVGCGADLTIAELARLTAEVVGYRGELAFDPTRPDGTPRKLLDVSRLTALGWQARIGLKDGLLATYDWFRHNAAQARGAAQTCGAAQVAGASVGAAA
ncbi:MAG: hypothetical protein AB7X49_23455, partial [Geminicoccaceae bacterium]